MNKNIIYIVFFILLSASCSKNKVPTFPESGMNFIVANDLGRNGYYEQKTIAKLMGSIAEESDIEFIAAAGDVHHFDGVASVHDPLWMTNYELIYDHPELMIDWHAVLGNHEYRGNTDAVLDYSTISRRWSAPSRYYTQTFNNDDADCLFVFIDTTPLIDKYQKDSSNYPDAALQNESIQLHWIDSVLSNSNNKWKVVIGHHPIYAETKKSADERKDLQNKLAPILEKNQVDIYFSGHIHNFQHLKPESSKVEYVVNSSASLSRNVKPIKETVFCSGDPGFTVCNVSGSEVEFFFVNQQGEIIYSYKLSK